MRFLTSSFALKIEHAKWPLANSSKYFQIWLGIRRVNWILSSKILLLRVSDPGSQTKICPNLTPGSQFFLSYKQLSENINQNKIKHMLTY